MNKIYSFLGFVFLFLITSCVSNKDLVYLQKTNDSSQQSAVEPITLKPYRAQINDILTIKIKALDQKLVEMFNKTDGNTAQTNTPDRLYFDGFSVDDHGNIRIPVLGEVTVIGLTLDEIRIKIEKQLLDQYFTKEADIFVSIKLAGMRYTVNGEINSPGTKTLFQDKVTILEAIANSGDITVVGNRKEVMVIRQYPHGTEMHSVDLTNVEVMKSPYYYIQPNDFIYVKPLKQKSWGFGVNGLQSFTTILSAFTLLVTTYFLIKK